MHAHQSTRWCAPGIYSSTISRRCESNPFTVSKGSRMERIDFLKCDLVWQLAQSGVDK
jgi:hypothetical protein